MASPDIGFHELGNLATAAETKLTDLIQALILMNDELVTYLTIISNDELVRVYE